jgi:hypothetical protein
MWEVIDLLGRQASGTVTRERTERLTRLRHVWQGLRKKEEGDHVWDQMIELIDA